MATVDARLRDRAAAALRSGHAARLIILSAVVVIVILNTVADALAGYFLLLADIPRYRGWLVVSMSLSGIINIILVILVWVLFETLTRVERESDRLQAFMDNIYRRGGR